MLRVVWCLVWCFFSITLIICPQVKRKASPPSSKHTMADRHLDSIMESLKETAGLASQFKIEASDEDFAALSEIVFALCKTDMEAKAKAQAVEAAAREENMDEFEKALEANQVNITQSAVTKSARYKSVISDLQSAKEQYANADNDAQNNNAGNESASADQIDLDNDEHGGGNADGATPRSTAAAAPDIDPITKLPLQNPCRNRNCGHVYGMDSIVEALQTNQRMRCPIMGCGNRQRIQLSDLVPDKELARMLYVQRAGRKAH